MIIFARNMYKKMNGNNNVKSQVDLKKGLYLGQSTEGNNEDIFIDWKDLAGNVSIQGDTGVGKSMAMAIFLKQCIFEGKNIILLDSDVSDTTELLSLVLEFASEAGRNDDLKYVSLLNSNKSIKFNPLYGMNNEEISSLISTLIPAKDDFYIVMGYTITFSILIGLEFIEKANEDWLTKMNLPSRKLITFADIAEYSTQKGLDIIFDTVKKITPEQYNTTDKREVSKLDSLKKEVMRSILEQIDKDQSYFNKVSSTYMDTINLLSEGDMNEILCTEKTNPILDGFKNDEKGQILIVKSNYEIKEYSSMINKFLFSMLISEYGKIRANGEKFTRDMFLFIDEVNYRDFNGIEQVYNKAGGLGLRVITSSQASPISDNCEEDIAKIIHNNTSTKIYIKMKNPSNENNSINLIKEDIKSLKNREFVIQSSRLETKGTFPTQEKSDYLIDKDDWLNTDLNYLYLEFKRLVKNEKLQKIVKKGLEDIYKYKFKDDKSIDSDLYYLKKEFESGYMNFEKINLKEHSLNVFQVGLNKFKNIDNVDFDYELALVATLFHDFGKSRLIQKEFSEEIKKEREGIGESLSHSNISYRYIQSILRKDFKEEDEIINKVSDLVKNHHNKKENNSSFGFFVASSDYKAREIELFILNQDINFQRNILSKRLTELDKEFEDNRLKELDYFEKRNKTFDFINSDSFVMYEEDKIVCKVGRKSISHIKLDYKSSKLKNKYVMCTIVLMNGHSLNITIFEKDIEKLLTYV